MRWPRAGQSKPTWEVLGSVVGVIAAAAAIIALLPWLGLEFNRLILALMSLSRNVSGTVQA